MHSEASRAEPNMTPILDMVFQLITFFMLVINFKAADIDHELVLPVLGSAEPTEVDDKRDLIVLNVNVDGLPTVRGKPEPNIERFMQLESVVVRAGAALGAAAELPVTVVIRADRKIKFGPLMRVVDACKKSGFDKFDFIILRKANESASPSSGAP